MRLLVLFCVFVLFAPLPTRAGELITLEHEGLDRKVLITHAGDGRRPLIVFLHSYYNEARFQRLVEGAYQGLAWQKLDELAAEKGFAVAYPAAFRGRWAVLPSTDSTRHPETGAKLDDLGFVAAVVDHLIADGQAVADAIYLVGRSNGAKLTFELICDPAHRFAAAVTLVATLPGAVAETCAAKPVPYLALAGTSDRILPYDGWLYPHGRDLSVPETLQVFVEAHGCTRQSWEALPDRVTEDQSRVWLVWWHGCATEDGAVRHLRVEGAGHTIPRPELGHPDWVARAGGQNQDIETAEFIVNFLAGEASLPASE